MLRIEINGILVMWMKDWYGTLNSQNLLHDWIFEGYCSSNWNENIGRSNKWAMIISLNDFEFGGHDE